MPYVSPLPGGHTLRSNEGKLKHDELMELVTKLSDTIMAVEIDLQQTKKTYSTALTKLVLKVKKLEKQVGVRTNHCLPGVQNDVEVNSDWWSGVGRNGRGIWGGWAVRVCWREKWL
ncbi:hypothetical protein Tco_1065004 [Tanacetum coccineum]